MCIRDRITPNLDEARVLYGDCPDYESITAQDSPAILVKGGHSADNACNDILYGQGQKMIFEGARIEGKNIHGTGCVLSSAIAAFVAKGYALPDAVDRSKTYIESVIGQS